MPKRTVELLNVPRLGSLEEEATRNLAWLHATELVRMMGYQNSVGYASIVL